MSKTNETRSCMQLFTVPHPENNSDIPEEWHRKRTHATERRIRDMARSLLHSPCLLAQAHSLAYLLPGILPLQPYRTQWCASMPGYARYFPLPLTHTDSQSVVVCVSGGGKSRACPGIEAHHWPYHEYHDYREYPHPLSLTTRARLWHQPLPHHVQTVMAPILCYLCLYRVNPQLFLKWNNPIARTEI